MAIKENTLAQAHTALDRLITTKVITSGPTDGRLQVALAIASISSLVIVDATTHPWTGVPDDLFDHCFNDPTVGISDNQMAPFKANLTVLLSQIATDISQVPENAALPISKVAEYIRVSLLALSS